MRNFRNHLRHGRRLLKDKLRLELKGGCRKFLAANKAKNEKGAYRKHVAQAGQAGGGPIT
jgi:hypothetical protein